jgi:1-phosphofructokinase family hexose kinase
VIVCAAPNPAVDKLFVTDVVTVGAIHRPERVAARPGGKGLNLARAAHALGGDVVAVALLAGHAGRWISDALAASGPRTVTIWGDGETRAALAVAAGGTTTEFYEAGCDPGTAAWETFRTRLDTTVRAEGAAWVSLSGSLPPGVAPEEAAALVRAGRATGARVAVDHRGAALAAALDAGPDLVKVNRAEAAELTGEDDPARAAAALRDRAVAGGAPAAHAAAVVTLGADGALAHLPDGLVLRGALDLDAPYPTGSGDAFLGGLLVARDRGADWPAALALALGAGCANAEAEGAGSLEPARAHDLAARARVASTA